MRLSDDPHSKNIYQIFTHVKNKVATGGEVSDLLLYAKAEDEMMLDSTYQMSGSCVSVQTLDLNCDFAEIARQLNGIAASLMVP